MLIVESAEGRLIGESVEGRLIDESVEGRLIYICVFLVVGVASKITYRASMQVLRVVSVMAHTSAPVSSQYHRQGVNVGVGDSINSNSGYSSDYRWRHGSAPIHIIKSLSIVRRR